MSVEANRRHTLIARQDAGVLHFDVRLQVKKRPVFFAL